MFDVGYIAALSAGLLSFLSPCVLPLVPPYLGFLAGASLEELQRAPQGNPRVWRRSLVMTFAFTAGFATIFVMLGATATALGGLLADYFRLLSIVAGVALILLGLHFVGLFRIAFANRDIRFHFINRPSGLGGAYFIGLAFAFGWTPCVGPVLAGILMIAGAEDSAIQGAALLGTYALGLGIPFMLAALLTGPFMRLMIRFRPFIRWVEWITGGLLILTGVLFVTGMFNVLGYWLLETFPIFSQVG